MCVIIALEQSTNPPNPASNPAAKSIPEISDLHLYAKKKDFKDVDEFMMQLPSINEAEQQHIESNTKDQNNSTMWHNIRKGRVTSSRYTQL